MFISDDSPTAEGLDMEVGYIQSFFCGFWFLRVY